MSIKVVEASAAVTNDYIRVAANVSDTSSNINKVYAFAHSSQIIAPDVDAILTIIETNHDARVTMFDPNTGNTTFGFSTPPTHFQVIGFIRKVIENYKTTPVVLNDFDSTSQYHVYIVTQNNLGYNKVWESVPPT